MKAIHRACALVAALSLPGLLPPAPAAVAADAQSHGVVSPRAMTLREQGIALHERGGRGRGRCGRGGGRAARGLPGPRLE